MLRSLANNSNGEPDNIDSSSVSHLHPAVASLSSPPLILPSPSSEEGVVVLSSGSINHDVKFYKDDPDLYRAIAKFIEPAFFGKDVSVIIIIDESHIKNLKAQLSFDEAEQSGRLVILDEKQALDQFMRDDNPDADKFDRYLGNLIHSKLTQYSNILIYVEMVNLLYGQGNRKGAIELERLFNNLLAQIPNAAVLCGYALNSFMGETEVPFLNEVCTCHSQIYPAENPIYNLQQDAQSEAGKLIQVHEREEKGSPPPFKSSVQSKNKLIVQLQQREMVLEKQLTYLSYVSHEMRTPLNAILLANVLVGDILLQFKSILSTLLRKLQDSSSEGNDTDMLNLYQTLADGVPGLPDGEQKEETNNDLSIAELYSHASTNLSKLIEYNQTILACAEQQKKIVDNVLHLARLRNENEKFNFNLFELRPFFATIGKIYAPYFNQSSLPHAANKKQLLLEFEGPETEIWVKGDETGLSQVITNLLSNAIKFTPHNGKIKLSYSCEVEAAHTMLKVKVTDTGNGIAPENMPDLFKPFFQFNQSAQNYGGSGLGLTISKAIVERQGGELKVDSKVGRGTTFSFNVQCVNPSPAEIRQFKESQLEAKLKAPSSLRRTILIVEDNKTNQKLLVNILENDHSCFVANNGKEAVEKCQEVAFDIILMDIQMPVLNGIEATKQIRKKGLNQSTPIIALSGESEELQRKQAIDAGMNDYLTKPFQRKVLLEKLAMISAKITLSSLLLAVRQQSFNQSDDAKKLSLLGRRSNYTNNATFFIAPVRGASDNKKQPSMTYCIRSFSF